MSDDNNDSKNIHESSDEKARVADTPDTDPRESESSGSDED